MDEPIEKTMRMRTYVLQEILKTERDYVKTLRFLVHVFMERLQNRENNENDKLVPSGSVVLLLSNVEDIYKFHQEVLVGVEEALHPKPEFSMQIGDAFLKHKERFEVYAPYCANHERAQKKLNELTENQEFHGFILGCLLLGNYVNDVSMEGFLLTPIQRICKYPLLFRELLKKTPDDHPDYEAVKGALEMVKDVCSNVNEAKRQLEQLEKLEDLQSTIGNWEGANLSDTCTRLIKQGALLKISAGNIQERYFFLFDHLLVYTKKINSLPMLQTTETKTGTIQRKKVKRKKSTVDQKKWIFKGRISTELMEIENLEDGASDFHCGGYTVTNGWKVLNAAKNKWFVLLAKDKEEKESWLNEFIMERERRRSKVNIDQRDSIDVMHNRGKRIYYKATHQGLIKDRKSLMKNHPKAMLGNEFIDWLVQSKEAPSVDEAVLLGQALLDCGIIHHVSDKHHFRNEAICYRFRYDDGTFKPRGENQDLIAKGLRIYCRVHCLYQPIVRDKERNLRSYKLVVEARKLVDWLIDQGDCQSREEAANLCQSICELGILHHALDKQDFKDDSSLFKFFPDEDFGEVNKLKELVKKSSKNEFKFSESYQTKTLLLLNVSDTEPLGLELKFIEEKSTVVITTILKGSQAQVQGFQPGMRVLQINNNLMTSCPSQEYLENVMKYNLEKFKLIHMVVQSQDHAFVAIPVTKEGMGFQIRGSNPCVVHAVAKGGMAMNKGLVKGHAIIKVNGANVTQTPHDEVASAIREGCKLSAPTPQEKEDEKRERSGSQTTEDDGKNLGSNGSLTVPTGGATGLKKSRSFKKAKLAMLVGINHVSISQKEKKENEMNQDIKQDTPTLQLLVANRHLERTCIYNFVNIHGVKTNVVEKMSEAPSIFDLAAQLLDVLVAEDERVLSDVQALEGIAPFIADLKSEVFERRRSLRYEVIHERLENYKRYKRHLASYMWPSYKEAKSRPSSFTAKDFCPTNCHVNLMTISHAAEKYNLRGLGLPDVGTENQDHDVANTIHTTHGVTCLAAPSFRSRGREGHGLMAMLRGVEGNTELMDGIRQIMVSLDSALLELRQGQCQLIKILNTEKEEERQGNYPGGCNYQMNISAEENLMTPITPPTSFYSCTSPNEDLKPKNPVVTPEKNPSHDSLLGSDSIQVDEAGDKRSAQNSPSGDVPKSSDSGHGGDETLPQPTSTRSSAVGLGVSRKLINDDGSATGNDSECDSGIHSNRGSMVGNEKLVFNFVAPSLPESDSENKAEVKDTANRISTISISNSSDQLAVNEDLQQSFKLSTSMPSLSPTASGSLSSPVKMRPDTGRRSRVRFSGRDRISMISATESTCSSEGIDSVNFVELDISADALDKLQGTMEHFLSKIRNLHELVESDTVKTVFNNTQDTTPERRFSKIIERLNIGTSDAAIKLSLATCEDTEQFADVINTLMESVDYHVNEVRTQLVLAVLLHEDPKLVSRRDKVFSQSLITAITAFSAQLGCAISGTFNNMKAYGIRTEDASKKWLDQCMSIGACIMFQTMLNPNEPDELAMLEDSSVGVYDLERVSFHFRAITGDVEPNANGIGYSMEGNRCALKVFFHLDKHVFIKLPPRLQAGGGVKVIPMLINHGLQDLGNLLYEKDVTMHDFNNSINEKALGKAYDYYKKFRAFHLDRSKLPRDTEARAVLVDRLSRPLNALDEVMTLLENNVKERHGKPNLATTSCGVLPLAAEFCQRLGACGIIACHNGVHRSSTLCDLQQALLLVSNHGMAPKYLLLAAYQMGKLGAREHNETKNRDSKQRSTNGFPRLFRRNYSDAETATPT